MLKFDLVTKKYEFFMKKKFWGHSDVVLGTLQHPEIGSKFNFERIWGLFFQYLAYNCYFNSYLSLKYIKFVV